MGKDIHGPVILRSLSKAQAAREDTTALLLAKLVHIVETNPRSYYQMIEQIKDDPDRAENVIHALVGMVVQYSEGATGFLKLCETLTQRLVERRLDELPMETKWR